MIVSSVEEIKNDILSKSLLAVLNAQDKVHKVIDDFLKQHYSEYAPWLYERTSQLLHSLVKSDVRSTGNGWEAEVYFDIGALNYSVKYLEGRPVPNKGWSEQKTLDSAMHGMHGGKVAGTAIWDESVAVLDAEAIETIRRCLVAAGVPLR